MVTIVHAVDPVYGVRCEAQIKIVVALGGNDSQVVPFIRVPNILFPAFQHIATHLVIGVDAGCAFGTAVINVGILQVVQFSVVPHLMVLQPDVLVGCLVVPFVGQPDADRVAIGDKIAQQEGLRTILL